MSQHKPTQIKFVQHSLPPLEAGEYRVTVSQDISVANDVGSSTLPFAVYGERFKLAKDEVVKVFPPAKTTGEYANTLPHVMLKRKTLPWERSIETASSNNSNPKPKLGIPHDANDNPDYQDIASWLAILVIDQDDPPFANPGNVSGASRKGTVTDLFNTPANTLSYFSKAKELHPNIQLSQLLDYGEAETEACQLIDLPIDLFKKIAPAAEDLKWLAHNQIPLLADGTPESEVAMVIGSRLPKAGKMSTAHLVSLEGMEAYLPDKEGNANLPSGCQYIRLVSLYNWTFNAVDVKITFSTYLEHLNQELGQDSEGLMPVLFRKPLKTAPTNPITKAQLAQGFLPFSHYTRTGDQLISWYKGPLVPESPAMTVSFTEADSFHLPAKSSDALTVFNPHSGMFDISYSSAWELGRLLVLSSRKIATALFQWKTELVYQTIQKANEQNLLPKKTNRRDYFKALDAFLNDPNQIKGLYPTAPQLPKVVVGWLSDLIQLKGVPFHYLVPDKDMLPVESLKFFQIDRNWLACLFDGAHSTSRTTQSGWIHDQVFMEDYFHQALKSAKVDTDPQHILTGLLLRSQVVKGWWPGIRVNGYTSDMDLPAPTTELPNIRLDTLAPEVMICLMNGRAKRINIHEPAMGVHFGISPTSANGSFRKELRFISGTHTQPDGSKPQPGQEMLIKDGKGEDVPITIPLNSALSANRDALDITDFASQIKAGLITNQGLISTQPFTAAEFALEMVEGVEEVGFRLGTEPG
jgi:hypothetical protein